MEPADPSTLYLGTLGNIRRTRDGGQTWQTASAWYYAEVQALALKPGAPDDSRRHVRPGHLQDDPCARGNEPSGDGPVRQPRRSCRGAARKGRYSSIQSSR
jgi:hypothetical protein